MFVIVYRLPGQILYHGKTKPVLSKKQAIKFVTADAACERLRDLESIQDFSRRLVENASVEKLE